MSDQTDDLLEPIRHHVDRITRAIEGSGSMIQAVKNGAIAEGFVLGISCSGNLTQDRCDSLSAHFEHVLEEKLRLLALGL